MHRVNIAEPAFAFDPEDPEGFRGGLHRLGRELRVFGIRSTRDSTGTKRGYKRAAFKDAWERYPVTEIVTDSNYDE